MRGRSLHFRAILAVGAAAAVFALLAGCATRTDLGGVRVHEGTTSRALGADALAARTAGSVAVVTTDIGRGMAFVVDERGYLITNRHVIEDADHIESITFPAFDPPLTLKTVSVVYMDPIRDLALLRVQADARLQPLALAADSPAPTRGYVSADDRIMLMSRVGEEAIEAESTGLLARVGKVDRLEVFNPAVGPGAFLGLTADVQQGQSGGPVLDRWGRAVGVVTWTWKDKRGGFAIPISEATRMLGERPAFESNADHVQRASERARAFVEAMDVGDFESARRLTSPTAAREARGDALSVLLERVFGDGVFLQTFVGVLDEQAERDNPFAALDEIALRTGSPEFQETLGVRMEPESVITFFYEMGQAYLSARHYGERDREEALEVALRRLHSLDAGRSFVIARVHETLAPPTLEVRGVEIIPGAYGPRAVVTAEAADGARVKVQMRHEWGDWYIAHVHAAAD